jgi:hypothetical protein
MPTGSFPDYITLHVIINTLCLVPKCHQQQFTRIPLLVVHRLPLPILSLLPPSQEAQQLALQSIHVLLPPSTLHAVRPLGLHHLHLSAQMLLRYLQLLSNERQKKKNGCVTVDPSLLHSIPQLVAASRTAAEQGPHHHDPN